MAAGDLHYFAIPITNETEIETALAAIVAANATPTVMAIAGNTMHIVATEGT